jgi:RNA polymerase sigma factor (sigma-70 family)
MFTENATSCAVETPVSFNISQAIEDHLPLADEIARKAFHRFGRNFEQDDLQGYAHLGLVRAARKYAGMEYTMRQAIDFTEYATVRIWRNVKNGRDSMATIHRTHYRMIKRGEMQQPKFVRDGEDYTLADCLIADDSREVTADLVTDEMMDSLRKQNSVWAQVVSLYYMQELAIEDIAAMTARSVNALRSILHRAINYLRLCFNESAYVLDDRTGRKQRTRAMQVA